MKAHGILLSTDGPEHNVLKIKPPLVLGMEQARCAADVLDRALAEAGRAIRLPARTLRPRPPGNLLPGGRLVEHAGAHGSVTSGARAG